MTTITHRTTAAQANKTEQGFAVSGWKAHTKNTLLGFFSLTMPSGLILHGCSFHSKAESKWVGVPSQKFTKADGSVSYTPTVEFVSDTAHRKFQAEAVRAVTAFLTEQGRH